MLSGLFFLGLIVGVAMILSYIIQEAGLGWGVMAMIVLIVSHLSIVAVFERGIVRPLSMDRAELLKIAYDNNITLPEKYKDEINSFKINEFKQTLK